MRKIVRIFFLRAVWFPLEETRKKKFVGYYLVIKIKMRRSEDLNGKFFGWGYQGWFWWWGIWQAIWVKREQLWDSVDGVVKNRGCGMRKLRACWENSTEIQRVKQKPIFIRRQCTVHIQRKELIILQTNTPTVKSPLSLSWPLDC